GPRRGRVARWHGRAGRASGRERYPRRWRPTRWCGPGCMPEVRAPDAIVPDVHEAVAVEVGHVPTVRRPEVLPPDPIVAYVDDAVTVHGRQDARRGGGGRDGRGGRQGARRGGGKGDLQLDGADVAAHVDRSRHSALIDRRRRAGTLGDAVERRA